MNTEIFFRPLHEQAYCFAVCLFECTFVVPMPDFAQHDEGIEVDLADFIRTDINLVACCHNVHKLAK